MPKDGDEAARSSEGSGGWKPESTCPFASRDGQHVSECLHFTVEKNPTVKKPLQETVAEKQADDFTLVALLVFLMVLFMKEAWEVF